MQNEYGIFRAYLLFLQLYFRFMGFVLQKSDAQQLLSTQELLTCLLQLKMSSKAHIIRSNIMAVVLWSIWLERNRRIFQEVDRNQNYLWNEILSLAALWSSKFPFFCNYDVSTIALNWKLFL